MNKKISLGAALSLVVFVAAAAVFITMGISTQLFGSQGVASSDRALILSKLSEIDATVSQNYVGEINDEALTDGIMDGYFTGLGDQHSYYLTADEYNELILSRSGKSTDLGIYVTDDMNGGAYIYYVMNSSPADSAGLKKGDVITAVAGKSVSEAGFKASIESIKSMTTTFELTIKRAAEEIKINVTPEEFNTTTIEAKILELGNIGYIRIYNFVDSTDEQFSDAVETMLRQDVSGFIFDVRHNNGGTLSSVVNMIDKLVPEGPIVYKVDKNGEATIMHKSNSDEVTKPMLVLMDGVSASASELFACALRDYKKAELIGAKTYGKGSMQDIFTFKDGSAINLTTTLFNPPLSENFDGIGIMPDYEVKLNPEPENFFLLNEDDDSQLHYAVQKMMEMTGQQILTNGSGTQTETSGESSGTSNVSSGSSSVSNNSSETSAE